MKKLMLAALVAGSMVAMAEDAAKPAENAAAPAAVAAKKAARAKMSPEERKAMFEKRMAERKAAMEKKSVEIIKKYGLDDEKAKALFNELQAAMMSGFGRRPRPNMKKAAPKAE